MKSILTSILLGAFIGLCICWVFHNSHQQERYDQACRAGASSCATTAPTRPSRPFDDGWVYVCNRGMKTCSRFSKADASTILNNSDGQSFETNPYKLMNPRKPESKYQLKDFSLPFDPPSATLHPKAVICGKFPAELPPMGEPTPNPTNPPVNMCIKPDNAGYPMLMSYVTDVYAVPTASEQAVERSAYLMDSLDATPVKNYVRVGF